MEIKNVNSDENNQNNEYPKFDEMDPKKVKKSIPKKWIVLGITTVVVGGAAFAGWKIYQTSYIGAIQDARRN